MKKLLSLAVILILSLTLVLPVSAADTSNYNEAELKDMFNKAFKIYIVFDREFHGFDSDSEVQLYITDDLLCGIEEHTYYARRNDEHRIWTDFQSVLDSCVTEKLKSEFIKNQNILNIDGYTYSQTVITQAQNQGLFIEYFETAGDTEKITLDDTFVIVAASDTVITAEVSISDWDHDGDVTVYTVEYTNTDKGWRISGGTFINEIMLIKSDCFATAPQTGFATYAYAAASVIAAAGAVAIVKRHRKVM